MRTILPGCGSFDAGKNGLRQQVIQILFPKRGKRGVILAQDGVGEVALALLEFEDALLDGVLSNDAVGEDGAGLADAVRAVNGLGFDGRVPPGVEEIVVIGRGEVQPGAVGFQAEKEDGAIGIGMEVLHALLAVVGGAVEAGLQQREQAGELGWPFRGTRRSHLEGRFRLCRNREVLVAYSAGARRGG